MLESNLGNVYGQEKKLIKDEKNAPWVKRTLVRPG